MEINILYYIILFIFLAFSSLEVLGKETPDQKKTVFLLLSLMVIGFCGFRPINLDKDIQMYHDYFNAFCNFTYHDIFFNNSHRIKEKGYIIFNKLFCNIGFRQMIFTFAFIGVGVKSYIISKKTVYPVTAIFIYLALFLPLREFTQIRDAVASSFLVLAIFLYQNRRYFVSVLVFLVAVSFHLVALIYIPVILLLILLKREYYYAVLLFFGGILFFINPTQYLNHLSLLPDQIVKYNQLQGVGSFLTLIFGITALFFYHYSKKLLNFYSDYETEFLVRLSYISVFFGLITFHHVVLSRLSNALFLFVILLFVRVISFWNIAQIKYFVLFILVCFYYLGLRNFALIVA